MVMFERLATQVPLFRNDAPWAALAAVVLFVLIWFKELNTFLSLASAAFSNFHPTDRQRVGGALLLIFSIAWQLLNATLTVAMVYRRNWARVFEFVLTSFEILLIAVLPFLKQKFNPGLLYFGNAAATALLLAPSARVWFLQSTQIKES
jgi:hypothetical protein